jgi:hypothetical protein
MAVLGGLVLGSVCGVLVRRVLDRDGRRPALREVARPSSLFVFWLLTAGGVVLAIGVGSPDTLDPVPRDIVEWVPRLAVAGLFLIAGYGIGLTVAAGLGGAIARASGQRRRWLERSVQVAVMGGAGILALDQLGVDTTILRILIAAVAGGVSVAFAGIAIVGSRSVAADIAAGRVLQRWLSGERVVSSVVSGRVVELGVTHVVIEDEQSGKHRLVPYSRLVGEIVELG